MSSVTPPPALGAISIFDGATPRRLAASVWSAETSAALSGGPPTQASCRHAQSPLHHASPQPLECGQLVSGQAAQLAACARRS